MRSWHNSASTLAERPFWASCGQNFQYQMGRLDALLTISLILVSNPGARGRLYAAFRRARCHASYRFHCTLITTHIRPSTYFSGKH